MAKYGSIPKEVSQITAFPLLGGKVSKATFLGFFFLSAQTESFTKGNGPFSSAKSHDTSKADSYIAFVTFSANANASTESYGISNIAKASAHPTQPIPILL